MANTRAIAGLLARYYTAAEMGDGATACSLTFSLRAEEILEQYGQDAALAGNTCGAVMSKLFKLRRQDYAIEAKGLKIVGVRVYGKRASAILQIGKMPALRIMHVITEDHKWTVNMVIDEHMP